jgi:hypothetical protein
LYDFFYLIKPDSCSSVSEEQETAKQKAEQIRRCVERKKKARHMKQGNPNLGGSDEEIDKRSNNTVCSIFLDIRCQSYSYKFTSQVVASKPAALVQRINKVPPAPTMVIVSGTLIISQSTQEFYIQPQNDDCGVAATRQKHSTAVSHRIIPESRSPSPDVQHQAQDDQAAWEEAENEDNHSLHRTPSSSPSPDSQPSSPSIQTQRKRRHSSLDSIEAQDSHVKAQKINEHTGRPRASDYEDVAKDMILHTATVY